jgi:hypothetical protein
VRVLKYIWIGEKNEMSAWGATHQTRLLFLVEAEITEAEIDVGGISPYFRSGHSNIELFIVNEEHTFIIQIIH